MSLYSGQGTERTGATRSTPLTPPRSVRTAELQDFENMPLKRPTPLNPAVHLIQSRSDFRGEQVFCFNNRATKDNPLDDGGRFMLVLSQIAGRRLTHPELTGKGGETPF